jgi:cytochrome P450
MTAPTQPRNFEPAPVVDFDVFVHASMEGSNAAWAELREQCPVAWSPLNGGHWTIVGYEENAAAFRDWEVFSSARTDPELSSISISSGRIPLLIPEEIDPPEWKPYRRVLAELLSPNAVERLRPRVDHWVAHSIDQFIERGEAELAHDLAVPVPALVTMEWLGWPVDEAAEAASIFHQMAKFKNGTPEYFAAAARFHWLNGRVREELALRRSHPKDDALTHIARYEIDGVQLTPDVAESIVFLTIGGGVDTTTALTSAALVHLGQNPDDRARLLADPDLLETATEEFLRVYPPARTHARTVTTDTEFAGCPMRAGDRVLLSEVSANHDERAFPDADAFEIERFPNRHLSFGVGMHRCPGSHLARLEFKVSIREVLKRLPDFVLDEAGVTEYPNWSMIGGWGSIPVTFTPGARS